MSDSNAAITLESRPAGRGKLTVTARCNGDMVHLDTLNPASASARQRFVKALVEKALQVDAQVDGKAIDSELLRIADGMTREAETATEGAVDDSQDADALLHQMPQDIRDEADALLTDRLLIQRVVDDVAALNVAGEKELTAAVYLIGVSRLLDRPLAAIIQGPSSSGKSYLIEKTASLFPSEAIILATQMTPQALFHMRPGSLAHRFIVAGERSRIEDDDRAEATRALREMLSAHKLTKLMPMKVDGSNQIETVQIEQAGPIAYVESTTLAKVFDEDANRCVMLHMDERPEQTRRIIRQIATAYGRNTGTTSTDRIIQRHHALQRMLRTFPVVIPYADRLGELIVSDRVEVRRAFPQLMSMIQALTLLHQRQREQDTDGQLIATADDYQLARYLLLKPMARLLGGRLSDPARRFHDRLATWATSGEFTTADAKKQEQSSKSSVYGWLHELHESGIVDKVEVGRGRAPATWRLSGKTPDDVSSVGLPALEAVFPESTWKHGRNPETVTAS